MTEKHPALGKQILIDLYGASNLDSVEIMEQAMMEVIESTGATLL
ncbi:MAG: adenosylmethionine decarboxylase, partial [Gammaproteobacteria bacterium]|nr:adenosylmethionine decarboxylase [Gammaproteobacteria bacterium]